jgi:short-subunit dehydrogenase
MKKALVTGANGGIGYEMALILSKNGFTVTGVARNLEKLEFVFKDLEGSGHKCVQADLSASEGVETVAALVKDEYQVWVNNAGRGIYGDFNSKTPEDITNMLRLNIDALTSLSYEYLKTAKKGDSLINVASVLAFTSFANATAYSGTKAYVVNFCQGLWAEYRKKGVHVQAFCPGATHSDFHNRAGGDSNKMPTFIFQTSKQVAKEFWKGFKSKKGPVVVSGRLNRFFVFLSRVVGTKIMALIQGTSKVSK